MRVLVVALAFAASAIADTSVKAEINTADGNVNIRLPRDGSLMVQNRRSIDIVASLDELKDDLANTRIHANTAAFNASLQAVAEQSENILELRQDISSASKMLSHLQTNVSERMTSLMAELKGYADDTISDAVDSINSRMDSLSAKADKTKKDATDSIANLDKKLTTQVEEVKTSAESSPKFVVGWKECAQIGSSGADRAGRYYHYCDYTKKRDDTVLIISSNYDTRQINGNSIWRLRVDKMDCKHTNGAIQGELRYRLHGSSGMNLHRPVYIKGTCWKLSNGKTVSKGKHRIDVYQQYLSSDSYYNWESTARIMIEEVVVDEKPTITPNPPGNGWA